MKLKMCLAKIATSLLSILDFVLANVVLFCAAPKELPPLIVVLLVLSWICWVCGVYLLQFGLLSYKRVIFVYGYGVLCVLRLVYNVLLVLFLAVLAVFVPGASQAKVLSDVMSTLTGPLFENVLASMEIRLTPCNTGQVIGWMLLALLCYSMLLVAQFVLLLLCAMPNSSGTSTTTTAAAKADKKKAAAKKTGGDAKTALLDV